MINKFITKLRIRKWKKEGLKIGNNFQLERNSYIDSSFPWLIEIGNNVTIAPDTLILCHDGSMKKITGYSKIGNVRIGDNVFIGAKCIILPNTTIGNNCVIAAGSIVKGIIEDNWVYGGIIAKKIKTIEQFKKEQLNQQQAGIRYDKSYTKRGKISNNKKIQMREEKKIKYVI